MKRKFGLAVLTIGVILIALGILIVGLTNDSGNQKYGVSEEETRSYIEKLTDVIIFGGSKKELKKLLYTDEIMDTDLMSGPEMYLRQFPSKDVLEGKDISEYKKAGDVYASHLEKKIQDNFEYNIEGISDGVNYWAVLLKYRSYYYRAYINDLSQIQIYFLELAGYQMDGSNMPMTNKLKVDSYRATIKAASVLDKYLDNYINTSEFAQTYINFEHKNPKDSSKAFLSYLMNLEGYSYKFQGNIQSSSQIQQYLSDVVIDSDDPLAL